MSDTLEVEGSPAEFIAKGHPVIGFGSIRAKVKQTGLGYDKRMAMSWSLRDGRVTKCQIYEDPPASLPPTHPRASDGLKSGRYLTGQQRESCPKHQMLSQEEWRNALDRVAEAYDRFRPGYPAELPADLTSLARLPRGGRILEVGCGTGQLTMAFAPRGYAIVGLEPGKALASLARAKLAPYPNVRIVVSTLEDWIPDTPTFDLVVAAQSFHLVDPRRRFALVRERLSPQGALAVVWSYRLPGNSTAHRALQAAYASHAPALRSDQLSQDTPFEDDIDASGLFESVFMRKYRWTHDYTTGEYLGLLQSHASHETLSPTVRSALFNAIDEGLTRCGGHIAIPYVTRLYVATRRVS